MVDTNSRILEKVERMLEIHLSRMGFDFDSKAYKSLIPDALDATLADAAYYDKLDMEDLVDQILEVDSNYAVFLFRLGNALFLNDRAGRTQRSLHALMRSNCSMEIYFNCSIGVGLRIVHGLGTVIGSRTTIGDGFQCYQGVTLGKTVNGQDGPNIGLRCTAFANCSILGDIVIGNNSVIAANSLVLKSFDQENSVIGGSPAVLISNMAAEIHAQTR